jgi:uncharacterized protein with HEPN domain
MGEASTKISQATREKYPELPWREMVGMRNRLIHNYFDVDSKTHQMSNSVASHKLFHR